MIGDSLALGTAAPLAADLPDWDVKADARVGRPLAEGMDILAGATLPSEAGGARTLLAFSLYTNDAPIDIGQLEAAVRAASRGSAWARMRDRPRSRGPAARGELQAGQRAPRSLPPIRHWPAGCWWCRGAEQVARHHGWKAHDTSTRPPPATWRGPRCTPTPRAPALHSHVRTMCAMSEALTPDRAVLATGVGALLTALAFATGRAGGEHHHVRRPQGRAQAGHDLRHLAEECQHVSCAGHGQERVVKAFNACRRANGGVKGRCTKRVLGYRCSETPRQHHPDAVLRQGAN